MNKEAPVKRAETRLRMSLSIKCLLCLVKISTLKCLLLTGKKTDHQGTPCNKLFALSTIKGTRFGSAASPWRRNLRENECQF
jgi:hypothetical protein